MAPSSLKGHVGLGIYTTRNMVARDSILAAPDGPSVPVIDTDRVSQQYETIKRAWHKVFNEYWWGRGVPDHVSYEADDVVDFQITFGSLPNHHCLLGSIELRYPQYNDTLLDRFTSPGAGAISYAPGRDFFVDRDVVAGEELFLNYGYCARDPEQDPNGSHGWAATITMPADVEEAAQLIQRTWRQRKHSKPSSPLDRIAWPVVENEYVKALLPQSSSELHDLMKDVPDTISPKELQMHVARYRGTNMRTPGWIRSNGMCLEHMIPGPSHIPHAGQGGIAQHKITKGEIIVPAPLLHILDRNTLNIDHGEDHPNRNPTQLLLNYCLGHSDTPLLLCPNTNAILMNHCSARHREFKQHCPQGPNAVFRWASGWDPTTAAWQRMTIDEIAQQPGRGLAMEVIALRSIQPGEEIYVDYGEEWEEAWFRHVKEWKPPERTIDPWITAAQANGEESILPAFISGDLRKSVDHPHLFTGCRYWTTDWEEHEVFAEANPTWNQLSDEDLLEMYADSGNEYDGSYLRHSDRVHWPCSVLKDDQDGTYTVRIHQSDWYEETPWHVKELPRLLKKYPRSSIHYFVKPYHGDNHLKSAFRHPIGIPDEILPKQWKTHYKDS